MPSRKTLRFRMVAYTMLCVLIVGILGNFYLYFYLNQIIIQKANRIDEMYLKTMKLQLDNGFEELYDIGQLASNQVDISKAMKYTALSAAGATKACVQAQKVMDNLLSATSYSPQIYKMMIFNDTGLVVQASVLRMGGAKDLEQVRASALYQDARAGRPRTGFCLEESITPYQGKCLALLLPINFLSASDRQAYLYMEVSPAIVSEVLMPYAKLNHVFALSAAASPIVPNSSDFALVESLSDAYAAGKTETRQGGTLYKLDETPIANTDLRLCSFSDITQLSLGTDSMLMTLVEVACLSLLVGFGVALLSSHYITRPVRRLIARLQKVSDNDFSYDPTIEQTQDEFGQIGRVVNEMVLSVDHLIKDSVRSNEEKKNIEIAILQAQVNPHFLYNTLDSLHWMAVLQKNTGIATVTKSLSSLLRNMAKGVGDKIPLRQELSLLQDYVNIQAVRYADVFEYVTDVGEEYLDYTVVKMTLQPLVENAIIHGISAADRFGTVTVRAAQTDTRLILTVEDNGVGMTPEEIEAALHPQRPAGQVSRGSMSGIGLANVDKRLRLTYGEGCGLAIESEKNRYTRVTVTIAKEKMDVPCIDRG